MRLLCVSDLHAEECTRAFLKRLVKEREPDLVLLAGDLTDRGPVSFASDLLDDLKEVPVLAVAGNADTPEVARLLEERGVSLHARVVEFEGVRFAGVNGATTRFNAGIEYSEGEFARFLDPLDGVDVFVSHVHPFGMGFAGEKEADFGSRAVREWLLRARPKLAFSGHFHGSGAVEDLGGTTLVNVQALMAGGAALVEFPALGVELF